MTGDYPADGRTAVPAHPRHGWFGPAALAAAAGLALLVGCSAPAFLARFDTPATSPTPTLAPVVPCCPGPERVEPTPSPSPVASPARVYTDPAVPIEVTAGATFAISLREMPAAGFRYAYIQRPDPAVAVEIDSTSTPVAPGLIGSPSTRTWTFRAVGPGTTVIVVQQARVGATPTGRPSPYGRAEDPAGFTVTVRTAPGG